MDTRSGTVIFGVGKGGVRCVNLLECGAFEVIKSVVLRGP